MNPPLDELIGSAASSTWRKPNTVSRVAAAASRSFTKSLVTTAWFVTRKDRTSLTDCCAKAGDETRHSAAVAMLRTRRCQLLIIRTQQQRRLIDEQNPTGN